jgi:hypothetical protein
MESYETEKMKEQEKKVKNWCPFFCLDKLGPLTSFPFRILGWGISSAARPLSRQDNTNTEETQTDIHASSEIRTHDPFV